MAFFRKAGNILGRTVSNYISPEISSSKPYIFQAIRCMSSSKLFIGGLSYSTDDMSLREAFNKYGDVSEARVIMDRETGRSRGFGFVTYSSVEEASAAIQALDQQELHGRRIRVDYANDRVRGYGGGGFRGGNFGGGGGSYNSGGFGGSYGTGGGYNSNYGDGGNYGGGGYGGSPNSNYRDDSFGSGTGSQGGTNYASNNSYDGGNLSYGGDSQNLGVAGGAGGSDNFNSSNAGTGSSGYGDNFGSTNYASTNSYNGGNLSYGGDGQNFGVAGGVGGSDNFFSGGASVSSSGDGNKFGSEQTNYVAGADEGSRRGDSMDDNYRDDDDTPDNYADKRS